MLPYSEACERNKEPILSVLRNVLDAHDVVLEVGSGTGQHAVHFASQLTHITWQPTERQPYLMDLAARVEAAHLANLQKPIALDVRDTEWPFAVVDAVFTANTLHIMSWAEVVLFFKTASRILRDTGCLCVYGPFRYSGHYTSESNREFDAMLQQRDPLSALRDRDAVTALAIQYNLQLKADHDLPAYNRLLVFRRAE